MANLDAKERPPGQPPRNLEYALKELGPIWRRKNAIGEVDLPASCNIKNCGILLLAEKFSGEKFRIYEVIDDEKSRKRAEMLFRSKIRRRHKIKK